MNPGATVVLVAHGSRLDAANDAHLALTTTVAAQLDRPVLAAFLEFASPTLPEVLDAAAASSDDVVVLPYFVHPGRHVREHLPELLAAARDRHPDVAFDLLAPFGDDPELAGIVAGRLRRALG